MNRASRRDHIFCSPAAITGIRSNVKVPSTEQSGLSDSGFLFKEQSAASWPMRPPSKTVKMAIAGFGLTPNRRRLPRRFRFLRFRLLKRRREEHSLPLLFHPAFALQLFSKRVPAVGADVVFLALDLF